MILKIRRKHYRARQLEDFNQLNAFYPQQKKEVIKYHTLNELLQKLEKMMYYNKKK